MAGVGGDYEYINYGRLRKFVATGAVTDMLSPEYDMQSRIEFDFSTDIFADSGTLYSDDYIEHRHREKVEFLKKLSISSGLTHKLNWLLWIFSRYDFLKIADFPTPF